MFMLMVILGSAFLTILLEALVFITNQEYRSRRFMIACVIVNFTTNILLNLCFWLSGRELTLLSLPVLLGEAVVFIVEFIAYGLLFRFSWKLCGFVFLANVVTFSISFLFEP